MTTKQTPECPYCQSKDVRRDATAAWSDEEQTWVLISVYDAGWCSDCESDIRNFTWRNNLKQTGELDE